MQRFIVGCGGCFWIFRAFLVLSWPLGVGLTDAVAETGGQEVVAPSQLACSVEVPPDAAADASPGDQQDCTTLNPTELAEGRKFLLDTARAGHTMMRQGPELAIARLHPEFVTRLAGAIREARAQGLSAGIFSAYRPPAFGVGGFSDKFNSLHSYGLAVDMYGIGMHHSWEANRWHEIAGRHGVVCPYGPRNRKEWNHCQPTNVKIVLKDNPLRETITGEGPRSLESMFVAGSTLIVNTAEPAFLATKAAPESAPPKVTLPSQAYPDSVGSTGVASSELLATKAARNGLAFEDTHRRSRGHTALLRLKAGQPADPLQSATETARARLKRLTAEYARTAWARHIAALRRVRGRSLAHPRRAHAAEAERCSA
jgi:hypothetical protein